MPRIRSMSSHATVGSNRLLTYSVGVSPVPAGTGRPAVLPNVMCGRAQEARRPARVREPLDERLGRHAGRDAEAVADVALA